MIPTQVRALHAEESEEGIGWPESLSEVPPTPFEQAERVVEAVAEVGSFLQRLHEHGVIWAGFRPEALVWTEEGLKARELLAGLVPLGELPAESVPLSPGYSAPELVERAGSEVGRHTDVYHLGLLFYYLAARKFPQGTVRAGLQACRYQLPRYRIYDPTFPVGLEHVWARATQANPRRRFLSIRALVEALRRALAEARARARGGGPLQFEVGLRTEIGSVKGRLCPENQDCLFPDPARGEQSTLSTSGSGILAIADGVTRCQYGSGSEASRVVIDSVRAAAEPFLAAPPDAPSWTVEGAFEALRQATIRATEGIARHLPKEAEARPESLMTSTLLAAVLRSHQVLVGNTGNCRAFLATPTYCEQINLEDDLFHARLRSGIPPEEVRAKRGNRSLRRVIGACKAEHGEIVPDLERVRFSAYRASLAPGDFLLLCSDGLVEPGAYLEPQEAYQMLREQAQQPAQELCDRLVQEADSRQKPPTLGDNISCILVKVLDGPAA